MMSAGIMQFADEKIYPATHRITNRLYAAAATNEKDFFAANPFAHHQRSVRVSDDVS